MKTCLNFFLISLLLLSCTEGQIVEETPSKMSVSVEEPVQLSKAEAERLMKLPIQCIDLQYPNKLNQVIGGQSDLREPKDLHPAFYGCFDWHSAVHGHWSLVRLLKKFPDLEKAEQIKIGLLYHLSKENIAGEVEYFKNEINQGFERMYGWAWLLKLTNEVITWEDSLGAQLSGNLRPLADLLEEKVIDFLPRLQYPIRVGTHTNTAFAMGMIYDYAVHAGKEKLKQAVELRAKDFYLKDKGCPMSWEPSGYDFLSPCLEEADLMAKILGEDEYRKWLADFLPDLQSPNYRLEPGIVKDRTDGHLVHLDGLNFSRAWCLYAIAEKLPEYSHLVNVANEHIRHSLPQITDENYEGTHWLASFALLALR